MSSDAGSTGCRLPEAVRLQYLDAMGISCWQSRQPENDTVAELTTPQAEIPATTTTLSQPVTTGWDELEQMVAACQRCEALCQSRTQTVFGVGNRDASLMVIGEAPGRDEDIQGEPFVGRAGQLLNAMLKAINLAREQVFIANILKCRPPQNRDPSPEEAAHCRDYLEQQIALVEPDAILVVGRIAAQNLLGSDEAIGRMRGREHAWNGIPVVVTYHPAYLLRKPSEKRKSWQDLQQLQSLMQNAILA